MKRTAWTITLCVLVLLALTMGVLAQGDGNLLLNPGFEGVASPQDGIPQIQVVEHWRAFWKENQSQKPDWALEGSPPDLIRRPEYKPLPSSVDSRRVREGQQSMCLFSFHGVLIGGLQQTVMVSKGSWLKPSAYGQSWASEEDDSTTNKRSDMYAVIGVDPYGGTDPWARRVVWSNWVFVPPSGQGAGNWALIEGQPIQALEDRVTLFIMGNGRWASKHNDFYVDSARLVVVPAPGGPAPGETVTPAPTYTPYPLPTPYPTYTPTGGTPEPCPGTCPSITEIREAIREEIAALIFGVIGGK